VKTLTLTGDENTPAMPMTEAQVTHRGAKRRPLAVRLSAQFYGTKGRAHA